MRLQPCTLTNSNFRFIGSNIRTWRWLTSWHKLTILLKLLRTMKSDWFKFSSRTVFYTSFLHSVYRAYRTTAFESNILCGSFLLCRIIRRFLRNLLSWLRNHRLHFLSIDVELSIWWSNLSQLIQEFLISFKGEVSVSVILII